MPLGCTQLIVRMCLRGRRPGVEWTGQFGEPTGSSVAACPIEALGVVAPVPCVTQHRGAASRKAVSSPVSPRLATSTQPWAVGVDWVAQQYLCWQRGAVPCPVGGGGAAHVGAHLFCLVSLAGLVDLRR